MGSDLSRMISEFSYLASNFASALSVLIVGLDSVGKSTISYKLQGRSVTDVLPTGINAYTAYHKDIEFTLWDISGQMKNLKMFIPSCFKNTKAVILVVDSSDRERVDEAAEELRILLSQDQLEDAVFLVFANKQDLPNIMPVSELIDRLKLNQVENRRWHIQPGSAIEGTGLNEGMNWIYDEITK